jgi:hypothetical protein
VNEAKLTITTDDMKTGITQLVHAIEAPKLIKDIVATL